MHMWVLQRVRMTIDQPTEPVWGASPPTPQCWGLRETLVAVGVAAAHTDRTVAVSDQVSIQGTRAGQVTTATSVDIQIGPGGPAGPPGPAPHN